jgi:hypothetical protein
MFNGIERPIRVLATPSESSSASWRALMKQVIEQNFNAFAGALGL